jgi:MYXO-CTERM domain-containing protein
MAPNAKTIPVNFPGFGYDALTAKASDIHLVAAKGGAELAVNVGTVKDGLLQVVPAAPLVVGDSYTLTFSSFCSYGPTPEQGPISFTVVADAPIPTTLGAINGTPTKSLQDFGTTEATFDASYTLSPEMKPWASVYAYALTFDGREIETHATPSAAADALTIHATTWCDANNAKTTHHQLVLTAKLPFSPTLSTAATQIDFTCPASEAHGPSATTPTPPPATGVVTTTDNTPTHKGGCSSAAADPSSSFGAAAIALGLSAWVRRRVAAKGAGAKGAAKGTSSTKGGK